MGICTLGCWCLNCDRFVEDGDYTWKIRFLFVGGSYVDDLVYVGAYRFDVAFRPEHKMERIGARIVIMHHRMLTIMAGNTVCYYLEAQ